MTKVKLFINTLDTFIGGIDNITIKEAIGDSINNNRTVTVSQVIRYLTSRRNTDLKDLGLQLEVVYEELLEDLHEARIGLLRTDAFDINEFINVYTDVVIGGGKSIQREFNGVLLTA